MKWIILILLLLLISNLGNPWVQLIVFICIVAVIVFFIKSFKKDKKKDKAFMEDFEQGNIEYKQAYYNGIKIYSITFVTNADMLKKIKDKLPKIASDYKSNTYGLKKGETYDYRYSMLKASAEKYGLFVPMDYTSNQLTNTKKINKDLQWMHELSEKEFSDITSDDLKNILRWSMAGNPDKTYIFDSKCEKLYKVKLNDKQKKVSRSSYGEVKRLNENFEDYIDMFGNRITFR